MAKLDSNHTQEQNRSLIKPPLFVVEVGVDTIHLRVKEFEDRIKIKFSCFACLSFAASVLGTLATTTFHSIWLISGDNLLFLFWLLFLASLVGIIITGGISIRDREKNKPLYVVKQIAGTVDVNDFSVARLPSPSAPER